jgi:hypothetical protein
MVNSVLEVANRDEYDVLYAWSGDGIAPDIRWGRRSSMHMQNASGKIVWRQQMRQHIQNLSTLLT